MAKAKEDKKFFVNIEGKEYPWDKGTISVAELRKLGRFAKDAHIVEELPNGKEKTIKDSDEIELKAGHRYGRAPKFRRG